MGILAGVATTILGLQVPTLDDVVAVTASDRLHAVEHSLLVLRASAQAPRHVERALLLDVVVRERAPVLQLLALASQAEDVEGAILVLDLRLMALVR